MPQREQSKTPEKPERPGYFQSRFPMIFCNHSISDVSKNNLGYTYGVTVDQIPFEAELWKTDNSRSVTFYLPEIKEFNDLYGEPLIDQSTGTQSFHFSKTVSGCMVLMTGMVDRGMIDSLAVLDSYTELLVESGLINFPTNMLNAAGFLLTDIAGNDLVGIAITLEEDGDVFAETSLSWISFWSKNENRTSAIRRIK